MEQNFNMHALKELWIPILLNAGYEIDYIENMDASEFCTTCNALILSGVSPPLPPGHSGIDKKTRTAMQCAIFYLHTRMSLVKDLQFEEKRQKNKQQSYDNEIVEQNKKYNELLSQEMNNNSDEEKQKLIQEEESKINRDIKASILQEYENLGPEPEDGLKIKALLPDGQQIIRKFKHLQYTDDIYSWIAAQDSMFENDIPKQFIIKNILNDIPRSTTLSDAGLTRNAILHVILIE